MNILVSASDPGGGNAVLPVVQLLRSAGHSVTSIIDGASRGIFQSMGVDIIDATNFTDAMLAELCSGKKFDVFFAGTSIGDTIEKRLLMLCGERSIPSVFVIDFWSNYWQRFSSRVRDMQYVPDVICVMDEHAKNDMVEEGFDERKIIVTGNPHFDHFAESISCDAEDMRRVLFLSQPLKEYEAYEGGNPYGFDEYVVLSDVVGCFDSLQGPLRLIIRLHPREEKNKYDSLLRGASCDWTYDDISDLKDSLSRSGFVLGMNSVVLFQAACAGKLVASYQPNVKKNVLGVILDGVVTVMTTQNQLLASLHDYQKGALVRNKRVILPTSNATAKVAAIISGRANK